MRYPCSSHASPVSHVLAPPSPLTTKLGDVATTLAIRFDCLRTLCLARVPNATSCLAYFFVLFGFASLCASRTPYLSAYLFAPRSATRAVPPLLSSFGMFLWYVSFLLSCDKYLALFFGLVLSSHPYLCLSVLLSFVCVGIMPFP